MILKLLDHLEEWLITVLMAAATVGPVQWPQALACCTLLQQQFPTAIENKK